MLSLKPIYWLISILTVGSLVVGLQPLATYSQYGTEDVLSVDYLANLARTVTVKVSSDKSQGSGLLVQRHEQSYLVVTNQHVIVDTADYSIQTFDGQRHPVTVLQISDRDRYDLSFLKFQSPNSYPIASLETGMPKTDNDAFAAGFPVETLQQNTQGFVLLSGKVSTVMDRPFVGGYQIGNTIDVGRGMSGGPLLNRKGRVIGINGMAQDPVFTNPYIFEDGSTIPDTKWKQASQLSWAIPTSILFQNSFQFLLQ